MDRDLLGERLTEVFDVVGPLYRRAQRAVERAEDVEGVPIGVRAVLDLLRARGPMTVPQIGRAQSLSRQFVQRMVNSAQADGLVRAVPNPAHRRSMLLELTPTGAARIRAVHAREHRLLRDVGGDLTEADVDACLRVLRAMLANIDPIEPDTRD